MNRLRKSFRKSFKRKEDKVNSYELTLSNSLSLSDRRLSIRDKWHNDLLAVKSGVCSFQVKYLGCTEVQKSRGVDICEEAFETLKSSKIKSVRAVIFVSGDGIRIVEEKTRALLLDQAVDKVSFCAPDRSYEGGFSYICRNSSTQTWMCYCLIAKKDPGERLCNAFGCAFSICVNKKKTRPQEECLLSLTLDEPSYPTRSSSKILQPVPASRVNTEKKFSSGVEQSPPDFMFQRQASFNAFASFSHGSTFKRQFSLKVGDLPSTIHRQQSFGYQQFTSKLTDIPEIERKSSTPKLRDALHDMGYLEKHQNNRDQQNSPEIDFRCQEPSKLFQSTAEHESKPLQFSETKGKNPFCSFALDSSTPGFNRGFVVHEREMGYTKTSSTFVPNLQRQSFAASSNVQKIGTPPLKPPRNFDLGVTLQSSERGRQSLNQEESNKSLASMYPRSKNPFDSDWNCSGQSSKTKASPVSSNFSTGNPFAESF